MNATHDVLMAKSNHIFAWPFKFKVQEKAIEKFTGPFEEQGWIRRNMDIAKQEAGDKLNPAVFMLHQYLSASAKDIFIHKDEHICGVFEYPFQKGEKWEYLVATHRGKDCLMYRLPVASVELHVYRHGVGILLLHVVNERYTDIEDIKKINDYGRRVFMPVLPDDPDKFMLCGDKLGIIGSDFQCVTNFLALAKECLEKPPVSAEGLWKPAGFLYDILNCRLGAGRSEKRKDIADILDIRPTSDDRMFLMCLIRDDALSWRIGQRKWQFSEELDKELQELLYSIIFADPDSATCQDSGMRAALLEKAIYPRWLDYGTLYGVTPYSMTLLTSEAADIEAGVLRPFIIEYVYLLSLVLSQRIGIASYSEQAGRIVRGVDMRGTIKTRQARTLINLQEKYITFKNQILILEASCQEQGIDIYQLLQKQMMVQQEQEILDEQLESLYEATNVSMGNLVASKGIWWAIAAIVVDVVINIVAIILT